MNFGALQVTNDVSLHVASGTRHAIIGPNGAGKTTLFNIIAGELTPTAGSIKIDDREVSKLPIERRAQLGLLRSYQKNNLFASRSVRENLLLADISVHRYGHRFLAQAGQSSPSTFTRAGHGNPSRAKRGH